MKLNFDFASYALHISAAVVLLGACAQTPAVATPIAKSGREDPGSAAAPLPNGTTAEISAEDNVAAGPFNGPQPASPARYRIAREGTSFVVSEVWSDGSIRKRATVDEREVRAALSVVERHVTALRCDPNASRAPFLTRRIDISGPYEVHVQKDCRGTYPDNEGDQPAEHRAFVRGMRESEEALLRLARRALSP
jgi:hypothetical protein